MKLLILTLTINLIKFRIYCFQKALLKINFNSNNECDSFSIENLDIYKSYVHNIQIKSLLHKNMNIYEEDIKDKNINIPEQSLLISVLDKYPNKRLLDPFLLLNKKRNFFKNKFRKNIQFETKDKMNVLVMLPSYFFIPIKMSINYIIYYPYKKIYSKDYCIDYSMWKVNAFILLKFWNNMN